MSLPEIQPIKISYHKVKWFLEAENEAIHLAKVAWWTEEVSLKPKTKEQFLDNMIPHKVSAKPFWKKRPTLVDLRNILYPPSNIPLNSDFLMDNYKILVWNSRVAINSWFKSNFSDIVWQHRPKIVALLEPKVSLQSMGLFFKNMGFIWGSFIDPNSRYGGI